MPKDFDLAKAAPAAQGYMQQYIDDPTDVRKHTQYDQRNSDRDRYMDMAMRRSQGGASTGSPEAMLNKFKGNVAGSMASNIKSGQERANLAEGDIAEQRSRQYESEGVMAGIREQDAMNERTKELSVNQADAGKEAQKDKDRMDLIGGAAGAIASGFSLDPKTGTSTWGDMWNGKPKAVGGKSNSTQNLYGGLLD